MVTLLYYGLTFSADTIHLTENTYLRWIPQSLTILSSFISITLIEVPSVFILILLMDSWGRKPLMVVALLLPVRPPPPPLPPPRASPASPPASSRRALPSPSVSC